MTAPPIRRILFLCRGNTCRSPMAAAVAAARLAGPALAVASAGTDVTEEGAPADPRGIAALARRGIAAPPHQARSVTDADLDSGTLLLAMEADNLRRLAARLGPLAPDARIALLLDHAPAAAVRDIPDPFSGGPADYDRALALIEAGIDGLARALGAGGR